MSTRKKGRHKGMTVSRGFATSEHPAERIAEVMRLPTAQRIRKLEELSASSASHYDRIAKRRVAQLDTEEIG
jgi:hypothetical protein